MPIGIAIVGSGLFAKEQHLPAVQAATDLHLKAIYSRSLKSAQDLATGTSSSAVDLYSEDSGPGKSYADLLARADIEAVIIGLPILIQPEFIQKALLAGKHVLSEKPIAKDVATAQELMRWYQANVDPVKTLWAVGENWRYMTKQLFAAEQVRALGAVRNFRVNVHSLVKPDNKYYLTSWRKTPAYQGGFLLDGGVHMVAALRLILGSEDPITTVSAQSQQLQEYLPPVDTVDAVVKTQSGATGVVSLSWGSSFSDNVFEFACEKGGGVGPEVAEFARTIVHGRPVEKRQSPEEALADLEVLEGMLRSGEQNGDSIQLRARTQRGLAWVAHSGSAKFSRLRPVLRQPSIAQRDPANTDKMVLAKKHVPIVKKRTARFNRHQSDRFKCVPQAWRKPKGIDNAVRRRFKGQIAMPSIGYGSNKKTRHLMPSGHKAFLVHNPKDVELLLMHNRTYAAEIAHAVSSRKRVDIIAKAKALGVKVTNSKGRVTTEA
ncbi:Oxidoreductase N-terminal [Penicillium lagena]|uniref:Oxidoreductase N-terminal n=1 Tax=Penicillium lagena TaxID=94218 RepID=UPI002540CDDB|nr:Oxidoreductase N-terminal [Penicillium lagena]KAJ5611018.1 Oxidoreductase N-terminal [Penicillium lagena]